MGDDRAAVSGRSLPCYKYLTKLPVLNGGDRGIQVGSGLPCGPLAEVGLPLGSRATVSITELPAGNGRNETHTMKKTILIVEDNDLNMKLFHDLLEIHGYATVQTKDGREALRLAREHKPDLILMDIQLPEVSGLEVTRWIKEDETLKSIPIIAVTAFAMKGDEEKMRSGGCEAYIAKPISVTNFMATIEKALG